MLVYYFVPFIVNNRYFLFEVSSGHNSITVQNRTHVCMNFFDHKYLGNHLLQLCPKVVKHPVYNKTSVKRNILTIEENTSGSREVGRAKDLSATGVVKCLAPAAYPKF